MKSKKIYEEMANKDKIRYKNEIIEFEKFGYYSKYDKIVIQMI